MKRFLFFSLIVCPISVFAEGGLPDKPYIYVVGKVGVACAKSRPDFAQGRTGDRSCAIIMRGRDGATIEVSEWKSEEAIAMRRTKIQTSSRFGTSFLQSPMAFR